MAGLRPAKGMPYEIHSPSLLDVHSMELQRAVRRGLRHGLRLA